MTNKLKTLTAAAVGVCLLAGGRAARAHDGEQDQSESAVPDESGDRAADEMQRQTGEAFAYQKGVTKADPLIRRWPDQSRAVAGKMIDEYGQPDEATPSMLIWLKNGSWKRTVVYRQPVAHNFPTRQDDVIEQTVDYRVPLDKVPDLSAFDGSLIIDRTRGELSARSGSEELNRLALNLADDIVRNRRSVAQARRFMTDTALESVSGKGSSYLQKLQFEPVTAPTADPDSPLTPAPEQE